MVINHNLDAINTCNKLNSAIKLKNNAMEKLSSGLRINKAADDAAGASISEKMKAQIRGLEQAGENIQDGISLIQTAEAGLGSIQDPNLLRMRNILVQALNGTLTQEDRMKIQNELDSVKDSINDIANNTEFNTIKVLTPPIDNSAQQAPPTSNSKLDIIFMVDNSGSMTNNITTVKSGIEDFVSNLSGVADTKVAIVNLCAGSPYDIKDFQSDPNKIEANLNGLSATDGTRPYEIIENSVPGGVIGNKLSYREDSKKVFVLFTDTNNEYGGSTESKAESAVEGSNVSVGFDSDDIQTYVFGMGGYFSDTSFDDITNYTGGKIYHPSGATDICDKLKNDLVQDIKSSLPSNSSDEGEMHVIKLQVGANSGEEFKVELFDARTKNLGIDDVNVNSIEEAKESLQKVDNAIKLASSQRSKFGSYTNVLEHIGNNVGNYGYNITSSESRITDADMAKEVVEMTKNSIIEQSAQSILKQAENMPQSIINLMDKWQGKSTT